MKRASFSVTVLLIYLFTPQLHSAEITTRLQEFISSGRSATATVWIFFNEKQQRTGSDDAPVSDRSLRRRTKVRSAGQLLDPTDYPVSEEFKAEIRRHVIRIRQVSRWFNGVSAEVAPDNVAIIAALPFVSRIDLVDRFQREAGPFEQEDGLQPVFKSGIVAGLDYGESFEQLNQISIPQLHEEGITGQGVLIGVFDNGFRLLNHEAFDSLNVVATYDFVDKKESVIPNNPSSSFGSHGINTLSAIGGYKTGSLVGAAFGAEFLLARTENDSSETPLEEDNWIAAIEWADSIGVDVTSTSLVYRGYDPPFPGWTWQDMDGNTTMITKAADMAVARGILVVNAAGNFGSSPTSGQNTLGAPADGDSVLAVGAVDASGTRASFSSVGPTAGSFPRIKPDVMARGVLVRAASGINPTGYISTGGTSLACPLAAGVAALLLSEVGSATPMEVIQAMKSTADNNSAPNNDVGWGILNAVAALEALRSPGEIPSSFVLHPNYPNPFNGTTAISFGIPEPASVTVEVFDILGKHIRRLTNEWFSPGQHTIQWDGANDQGKRAASGIYLLRMTASSAVHFHLLDQKAVLVR